MPLLRPFSVGPALLACVLSVGCHDDNILPVPSPASDAGVADSGAEATDAAAPDARAPQPFNGDCSSARWANTSDACWNCFCTRCGTALNACDENCVKGVNCANDQHALVGDNADMSCELRAFSALCLPDPDIAKGLSAVTAFDKCLIDSHDAAKEHLRACEAECGITYTGDVCERFPAPSGG